MSIAGKKEQPYGFSSQDGRFPLLLHIIATMGWMVFSCKFLGLLRRGGRRGRSLCSLHVCALGKKEGVPPERAGTGTSDGYAPVLHSLLC